MLFADSEVMGTFKGFQEKGLEFSAEIIAPYNASMLEQPQLGQFILVELGTEEEASLGRITRFVPSGLLAAPEGEDYMNTMQERGQQVPEDLKRQRLKYRVQIKLLGAVRVKEAKVIYVPSQRRLPHLGAKVALPSPKVLQVLCQLSGGDTELGNYVLGEFIFCGAGIVHSLDALRSTDPELKVTININNLVSKRTVIFARAGYGKSNLMKFLVSELYKRPPSTSNGLKVGTLIFDPDGEYFWPDKVNMRPGLCDVKHLQNNLVVFTNREPENAYYGSWKAGQVKMDIRDLPARDVIGIAISPDRQEQQNILKLKALSEDNWRRLVDLIYTKRLQAEDREIGELLGYKPEQIKNSVAEISAARSNMFAVVRSLHDPESRLLSGTLMALKKGAIVVIDISLLSSTAGNMLAGLIMRRIFNHNQENFTGGQDILPVIAAVEEAQSILGKNLSDSSPFVEWVKEGRKYDLGAILITQQPGSMAGEIMSQADNWFCFHLLSEGDAGVLRKFNSHYSNDILAHLIGEPIVGNCFMWSAPKQPFVLPVRIQDFENIYRDSVNDGTDTEIIETLAREIYHDISDSLSKMKEKLMLEFKKSNTKFYRFSYENEKGEPLIGIYAGQLYHLIKNSMDESDTQPINYLKQMLFSQIFGEGMYRVIDQVDKSYYCAPEKVWESVLGKKPSISSNLKL